MLTPAVVAAYDVDKVSDKTVNACAVKSYPKGLTLTAGVFTLANGLPETHAVAGALTVAGGMKIVIDLSKQGCDGLSASSVALADASEEKPVVIAARALSASFSRNRIYRVIAGASLTDEDLSKFRLEGTEDVVLKVVDGDLCLVHRLGPVGFTLQVR